MHLLIASTSTLHGEGYLAYLQQEVVEFFGPARKLLFVPFARPGGMSYDAYTAKAAAFFGPLGFEVRGAHVFENPIEACFWADGFFTGGGNTFLLLKTLYETGYFDAINAAVHHQKPYMGTSAGSNVAGISIGTTNDMPIVHPPSLLGYGWLRFNLNPHYLDPLPDSTHMGETRETRIAEFHVHHPQPVLGLREGSWLRVHHGEMELRGPLTARLFRPSVVAEELAPGRLHIA